MGALKRNGGVGSKGGGGEDGRGKGLPPEEISTLNKGSLRR